MRRRNLEGASLRIADLNLTSPTQSIAADTLAALADQAGQAGRTGSTAEPGRQDRSIHLPHWGGKPQHLSPTRGHHAPIVTRNIPRRRGY
jgi:hypothetical protein